LGRSGRPLTWGVAIGLSVVIAHSEARAGECTLPTPACHLENGQELLKTDPKRAAEELLASYNLDERTETLALYATALQLDHRYALALETWQRIIVFRESELDAAKSVRGSSRRKAAAAAAQKGMDQAAEAIIKLWASVGRVRIQLPAGQQLTVTRDGVEVDPSRDVLVNAGRDELVFARKDGASKRVVVEVAAGGSARIEAPTAADLAPPKPAKPAAPKPAAPKPAAPKLEPKPAAPEPAAPEDQAKQPEAPLTTVRLVEEPRSRTMSRVGLGLAAGGVVALGMAGGLAYLSGSDYDRARELGCSDDGQCPIGPAADRAQRSNDRARLAQISAIGGGALLATGVTLWFVGRKHTHRSATDVTLRLAPSSAAIAWRF
jgi:hypothetical protein